MTESPSIPMTIPIEGFTLDQYLQYQSWCLEVQIITTHLHEWKTAKQEDKGKYETPILQAVAMANQRALKFPAIELPVDIIDPVTSAHLDMPAMIQELISLFSMRLVVSVADVQAEIDELGEQLSTNHRKMQNLAMLNARQQKRPPLRWPFVSIFCAECYRWARASCEPQPGQRTILFRIKGWVNNQLNRSNSLQAISALDKR